MCAQEQAVYGSDPTNATLFIGPLPSHLINSSDQPSNSYGGGDGGGGGGGGGGNGSSLRTALAAALDNSQEFDCASLMRTKRGDGFEVELRLPSGDFENFPK